ncbi:MAG: hypothetical protein KDJ15_01870 [Alphaproteobacteria bacterium]|nr:hypothetical protein [Alphaproteobacteria bacterium]
MTQAVRAEEEIDGMRLLQRLSGVLVETLLLFDEPEEGLETTIAFLEDLLETPPESGALSEQALPPPWVLDYETEQGRGLARQLFEEWLDCAYEFHQIVVALTHQIILQMEQDGQPRAETFRLFVECTVRALGYEIAAQELCDIVIEKKIAGEGWSLPESVSALSAVAGRCVALSQNACTLFAIPSLPDKLDQIAYVMTQEATRLGIPAGSDWRFGLAANDTPADAPYDLIFGLTPHCRAFFKAIRMGNLMDQAVACAKAAGRMLAIAAGGEEPDLEPVIAKPLAMMAMTETYRTVCGREMAVM